MIKFFLEFINLIYELFYSSNTQPHYIQLIKTHTLFHSLTPRQYGEQQYLHAVAGIHPRRTGVLPRVQSTSHQQPAGNPRQRRDDLLGCMSSYGITHECRM